MSKIRYAGFDIKGVVQGGLYRAHIDRKGRARSDALTGQGWETSQYTDAKTAVGQAIFLIDAVRTTSRTAWSPFAAEYSRPDCIGHHYSTRRPGDWGSWVTPQH
jgi:hypothetical protein